MLTPRSSPILNIDVMRKAKVLRDPCTGCQLCVLACPTDAIIMIDGDFMKDDPIGSGGFGPKRTDRTTGVSLSTPKI